MGNYLNPGNLGFQSALNSQIYVDKTGLIEQMNRVLGTEQRWVCVSRARRFGKTMAEKMLAAYYDRSCDSREQFQGLTIEKEESFEKHLNRYDVIFLDMQYMRELALNAIRFGKDVTVVQFMQTEIIEELKQSFPGSVKEDEVSLPAAMANVYEKTGRQFIVLIDEWDCLFRTDKENEKLQEEYLGFLRAMFKSVQSERFILLAYMTGILPIKKCGSAPSLLLGGKSQEGIPINASHLPSCYGTQSALNNFYEYTMADPRYLAEYVGFTEEEVKQLCTRYDMDFNEMQRWYDGYCFYEVDHIYNPKSVVESILSKRFANYWTATETYESLRFYIEMNFDGLKDAVLNMIGGGQCSLDVRSFQNDMVSLGDSNDVLTLLIHLGYLTFDSEEEQVYIPNEEIRDEFIRAVRHTSWQEVIQALKNSENLLKATWACEEEAVAAQIDEVHMDTTSILAYNDENSLSCVLTLAYYSARKHYTIVREMPAGRGFADLVFLPKKKDTNPAMMIELKWNASVEGAIAQMKDKKYVKALEGYEGEILLVGINYDKESKKHSCRIEKVTH